MVFEEEERKVYKVQLESQDLVKICEISNQQGWKEIQIFDHLVKTMPCYKKINKWIKKNPDFLIPQKPISTICMMQPTTSYNKDFPPLEEYSEKSYTYAPKIPSKIQTDITGAPAKISAAEATFNWQTENAIAQNHALKRINSKILIVKSNIDDNTKIVRYLIQLLQRRSGEFTRWRKKLGKRPVLKESPPKSPPPKQASKSLMIQEDQNPLTKFLKDYTEYTIPRISTVQNPELNTDTKESSSSSEETEFSSNEQTESEDEELEKAFQTTKVDEPSDNEMQDIPESSSAQQRQVPRSSIGRTTFTIDDLPPAKWPDRIQKFHSWLETRKLTEDSNYNILMKFRSRYHHESRRPTSEWWKLHIRYFNSAADVPFATHLISKPITIQFFPGCCVKTTVLGLKLPGKDIVVDIKIFSNPFVKIPKLFVIQPEKILHTVQEIKAQSCAKSHSEFLKKCPNLLWKNLDFFIKLPFKKNEDINPTKASHQGMNPDHLLLAEKECKKLQQQDLIEPSDSQWACEAFYRKIKIGNQLPASSYFLQDDKFPLSKKNLLFLSLAKARVFSKFDLKAGFWQLGIHPEDRPKTRFGIPNGHFQWKVMSFGLKTAPSLFQKAMIKIFHPLMKNALVYIDDVLLYSKDADSHAQLLDDFKSLIFKYGIMLSERKMQINRSEIQFLGMDIREGKYSPQPHIAQELLKFPQKDLSFKQVQQFIGIVNYLRDFIPKVSEYINPLRKMLKKDPHPWSSSQTKALQRLKEIAQDLPPLQIPSYGERILQTDATDKYWRAILLEKINGKKHLCGYKSGRFSEAEIHYHSTFKEILAVKKGMGKFKFHLLGYYFSVEMDMSSFSQMLKFKQKTIPHPQLLRWAEWFS
ncbi:hypothetical protein CXB51_017679 [Gossypium anomalum]|uniref:Reverse transcriptase domain-containing protein n=1 Tax=Gossypium anomalum TaxID=47600 RepID=A0A8J6D151_9ROSI|nr:hypothetical protein CXB51_017679 [Gossypium anomalum]